MASNIYSKYANLAVAVLGKTAVPDNITFNAPVVHAATGGVTLSWDEATDVDFREYVVQLMPSGGTWEDTLVNNTEIFRGRATKFLYTATSITPGVKNFLIKAVDTTDNYSATAGSTSVTITAPAWASQTVSHVINDGQITITWPAPTTTQFAVESYQVKYRTGNSSTVWAGAIASGHGTTEGIYSGTNSLTFPVTWGAGNSGSGNTYRTFIIKAKDSLGNLSSNEISKSIQIDAPGTLNVAHQFSSNDEGTKVDARVFWAEPSISSSQLPISHYIVYYKDWKTGASAPAFSTAGSAYLEALGTTEFKQEVDWGPSKTNAIGTISTAVTSYSSNDIRRYWVVPVDLAGNWGIAYDGGESDYIPEIEDVTVTRPNSITGLTSVAFSTKSSNGVVEINWNLPVVTTAPITSIRIFWEIPTWSANGAGTLTSTRGEKNSKAGTATKYSTPVSWGPTNGSGEVTRQIYFVAYDSIGNISVPTGIDVVVNNPAQISSTALTTQVIDNNVILRWTDPAATSLPIASYDVYRCPTGGNCNVTDYATTATFITNVGGTNTYPFFETAAGEYKYFVRTKDLAGNYSIPQSILTSVSEPRDFVALADVDSKYNTGALAAGYCSGFTATTEAACEHAQTGGTCSGEAGGAPFSLNKADCEDSGENGGIGTWTPANWVEESKADWNNIEDESNTSAVLPIDTTETWAEHFIGTGSIGSPQYTSPQAQITAGYHYFVIPESTAAYYQQWDLGTTHSSATVTLVTTSEDYGPTTSDGQVVTGTPEMFVSNTETDYELAADNTGGTWVSKGVGNNSVLAKNFRYVKVKVPYSSSSGAFKEISQQKLTLNLATVRDQSLSAESVTNAATGKEVSFNKTFKDITSITLTPILTGTCSNNSYTNRIACEAASATWTAGTQNTAIYDFNDVANPTSFQVYLLKATDGSFTTGDFTWQATGV